jgi:hypothetical protein
MRQLPRWSQFPKLYQVIVASFAGLDAIALGIAAVGLRSWSHAGASVFESVIWLLFLSAFFAPIAPRESSPHPTRSSSTARIVAGILILFLTGWTIVGGVDEFLRGVAADNILEVNVFVLFLTVMGAMLVWRGWQRRHGKMWETFPSFGIRPGQPTSLRTPSPGEKRAYAAAVIAFFILGSAVFYSFNLYEGSIAFQPSGWVVIPAGLAVAVAILVGNGRVMRKARICRGCGQHVPLGSNVCPVCGRPLT